MLSKSINLSYNLFSITSMTMYMLLPSHNSFIVALLSFVNITLLFDVIMRFMSIP
mgnify:CR=1 FL=1